MKVLLIRHGQSLNNEMRSQSEVLYESSRTEDSDISDKGLKDSVNIGLRLKEMGVQIDGVYTSAF
jgi:broad specificity phosphatase PhoE